MFNQTLSFPLGWLGHIFSDESPGSNRNLLISGNGQSRAQKKSLIYSGEGFKRYLGSAQKEGLLFKRDYPKLSTWPIIILFKAVSFVKRSESYEIDIDTVDVSMRYFRIRILEFRAIEICKRKS